MWSAINVYQRDFVLNKPKGAFKLDATASINRM